MLHSLAHIELGAIGEGRRAVPLWFSDDRLLPTLFLVLVFVIFAKFFIICRSVLLLFVTFCLYYGLVSFSFCACD